MDRGITLAGGGSLLQGFDERLREECQMPAQLADSPLTCVAVGSGRSLEEFETIHRRQRQLRARPVAARPGRRPPMYRKQVRRRRAVLVLLVVACLMLISISISEAESGPLHSIQRGVASVLGPIEEGADRALKPVRDMVNWFDETFEARGENDELQDEVAELRAGEPRRGRDAAEEAELRARRSSSSSTPSAQRLRAGRRAGDRRARSPSGTRR